jgi:hypothetical protein
MLASNSDNEVIMAVRQLQRLLDSIGMDFNHLAQAVIGTLGSRAHESVDEAERKFHEVYSEVHSSLFGTKTEPNAPGQKAAGL